jgi:hypothetical protein
MNLHFPKSHPYEVILFFYPSPGLKWDTPRALTLTTTRNKLLGLPRGIGHVTVLVRSPDQSRFTGMTQLNKKEGRKEVLFEGYGLGILLHTFKGVLEEADELTPELEKRANRPGQLSYLRIKTNEAINQRLFAYMDEYKRMGCQQWYGMRNRPLYGEGGGCSAFAVSFLELAGILLDEFKTEWTRSFNIPKEWIGGPSTGKKIAVHRMILNATRWATNEEPHEKGFFWDPDLMHAWAMKRYARELVAPTGEFNTEIWNQAKGLWIDASEEAAPTGKIFLHL